ncbi:MAG: heparinase II/III-family protein [Rhodococcus sp. (in: high G+C Gram-positive bacteria)]|uniref:heparinase II/III-family protein n=1 Tax=Rhodococcus sp. TaxID=1831 RepID=UPI002AD77D36|nr:heparinase II/III-family protein [Rhodococcus sp. (in: high G+C Gram-positive bacteria)]
MLPTRALFNYARHIPPRMLLGKLQHFVATRTFAARAAKASPPATIVWEEAFCDAQVRAFANVFRVHGDRFADNCAKLHDGEFVSNGVSYSFGSPAAVRWSSAALPGPEYTRWHHDLAFFSFAIPLINQDPDAGVATIGAMVRALDTQLASDPLEFRRFHWSPIAVASRALALTTALALAPESTFRRQPAGIADITSHLWRLAEVLAFSVERYLGFNHAATTEAGLAVSLLVQGKPDASMESVHALVGILEHGTLADGMWAERSPAYHVYMLVLVDAFKAMLPINAADRRRLDILSARMHKALDAVVHPDGELAIFNDCGVADAPTPAAVGWSAADSPADVMLPVAGFARVSRGGTVVVMDAGPMGPDMAIAHGHADFLSIEVSVHQKRLIVDPGVASIAPDLDRAWTRSAANHNGPTLKGCEPAEFFGAWRVGRRGTARFGQFLNDTPTWAVSVGGESDGYQPWGVVVSRTVTLDADGRLKIVDRWDGRRRHEAVVTFLVPVEWHVERECASELRLCHVDGERLVLSVSGGRVTNISPSRYFREGPMQELVATRVEICPTNADMTTIIDHR